MLKATLPAAWSEGQLFDEKALAVFKRCNLGAFREYPVIVRDKKRGAHSLTYLHIRNVIPPTAIDFGRSEFDLADMLGMPKGPRAIDSFEDWLERQRREPLGALALGGGRSMFEGLDTIDWSSLRHAHGPATDVPERLRSLLSDDPDVRLQACADLHETIWHQGTIYSASAAAIPFLLELLTHPDVHDPGCAVSLLGCIATGEGWLQYQLRVDGEPTLRERLAGRGRSLEEALEEERAALSAIHREVSAGLEHLLPYLSDREGLGSLVAETLGHFPEHASWLIPTIDAALASEANPDLRQSLAGSKARLTKG